MAGSRPPKPPSAMDGYRRLERTRSVTGAARGAESVIVRERRSPRVTRARVAGAARLLAFVSVLALIVGTSVSLASADERTPTPRAAKQQEAPVQAPVERAVESKDEAQTVEVVETVEVVDDEPAAAAVVPDPSATAASANGEVPVTTLPLTGDVQVRWLLLGGATFVLLGMLVQVAGQPLPARAAARS